MYAILFDANSCAGCEACLEACQEENQLSGEGGDRLTADNFTALQDCGDSYLRRMCMHCLDPACASACPVGALRKTTAGPVVYDFDRCIGCRYCMVACPFGVPRYEWASTTPRVRKCQMCSQRITKGLAPACASACPAEATIFGDRVKLIAEAWRRISEEPENYAPKVYGLEEVGGTSVLVIGSQEVLDAFDSQIPSEALPKKTWAVLSQIPTTAAVVGAGLFGVHWIIHRRMALAAEKVAASTGEGATAGFDPGEEEEEDAS